MTTTTAKTTRQKLYRFLIGRAEPVRELLRHLSAEEADQMLAMLINADNRRITELAKQPKSKSKIVAEMDAILS